jgi:hypothetical protein
MAKHSEKCIATAKEVDAPYALLAEKTSKASVSDLLNKLFDVGDEALITKNTEWLKYLDDFHFRCTRDLYEYAPTCYHYGETDKADGGIRKTSKLEDKDKFLAQQIVDYLYLWILPTF